MSKWFGLSEKKLYLGISSEGFLWEKEGFIGGCGGIT